MNFVRFVLFTLTLFILVSCLNDGNLYIPFKGTVKTYPLAISSNPSQFYGNVTLTELEDSTTLVRVVFDSLQNATHSSYPVAILEDNFVDGGKVLTYLNPVGNNKTTSKTTVKAMSGQSFSFSQFSNLDGHLKVFNTDTTEVLYQTDIGQNALTKNSAVYTLNSQNGFLFSGNAKFSERENTETRMFLRLSGVVLGQEYQIYLMGGSEEKPTKDTIAYLGSLKGKNPNFYVINIPKEKNGTILTYEALQKLDAHLAFYLNNNVVSLANIGLNAK